MGATSSSLGKGLGGGFDDEDEDVAPHRLCAGFFEDAVLGRRLHSQADSTRPELRSGGEPVHSELERSKAELDAMREAKGRLEAEGTRTRIRGRLPIIWEQGGDSCCADWQRSDKQGATGWPGHLPIQDAGDELQGCQSLCDDLPCFGERTDILNNGAWIRNFGIGYAPRRPFKEPLKRIPLEEFDASAYPVRIAPENGSAEAPKRQGMAIFYALARDVETNAVCTKNGLLTLNINEVDEATERTALHHACVTGRSDVIDRLLCLGARVDMADASGNTVFHLAAACGCNTMPLIAKLLAAQSLATAHLRDIDRLIDVLCKKDVAGLLVLHHLALRNDHNTAELLVRVLYASSRVYSHSLFQNNEGETPSDIATRLRHAKLAEFLVDREQHLSCPRSDFIPEGPYACWQRFTHIDARMSHPQCPPRVDVPSDKVSWAVPWPQYNPMTFTHDRVLEDDCTVKPDGQADSTDPSLTPAGEWEMRSAECITVISPPWPQNPHGGWPRNPRGRTGLAGRGVLPRWGPNLIADRMLTRYDPRRPLVLQVLCMYVPNAGVWSLPGVGVPSDVIER